MVPEDAAPDPFGLALPSEEVERIRTSYERAHAARRSRQQEVVDYLGVSLTIPPSVQPITPTSHLLDEAVLDEAVLDEAVLDEVRAGELVPLSWTEVARLEGERDGVPVAYFTLRVT